MAALIHNTPIRTGGIAVVAGAVAWVMSRRIDIAIAVTAAALWFSLGGHFVELAFLRGVRSRLGPGMGKAAMTRVAWWALWGLGLGYGAWHSVAAIAGRAPLWPWWYGGFLFVGIELIAHTMLRAGGQPSFFDDRG